MGEVVLSWLSYLVVGLIGGYATFKVSFWMINRWLDSKRERYIRARVHEQRRRMDEEFLRKKIPAKPGITIIPATPPRLDTETHLR